MISSNSTSASRSAPTQVEHPPVAANDDADAAGERLSQRAPRRVLQPAAARIQQPLAGPNDVGPQPIPAVLWASARRQHVPPQAMLSSIIPHESMRSSRSRPSGVTEDRSLRPQSSVLASTTDSNGWSVAWSEGSVTREQGAVSTGRSHPASQRAPCHATRCIDLWNALFRVLRLRSRSPESGFDRFGTTAIVSV